MDSMFEILYKLGLPSYFMNIISPVPATPQLEIQIAKTLPQQIGRIFGLSTYCDTVAPDGSPLITTTDATNIYVNLVDSVTKFFSPVRLDEMNFNFAGVPTPGQSPRYMPVNLPLFDLSTSNYINPTGVVSAAPPATPTAIILNLWYISFETYSFLLKEGIIKDFGREKREGLVRN